MCHMMGRTANLIDVAGTRCRQVAGDIAKVHTNYEPI